MVHVHGTCNLPVGRDGLHVLYGSCVLPNLNKCYMYLYIDLLLTAFLFSFSIKVWDIEHERCIKSYKGTLYMISCLH